MKFSGRLFFENSRKKFKLNLVLLFVLVLESKGHYLEMQLILQEVRRFQLE